MFELGSTLAKVATSSVTSAMGGVTNALTKNLGGSASGLLGSLSKGASSGIGGLMGNMSGALSGAVGGALGGVSRAVGGALGGVSRAVEGALGGVSGAIGGALGGVSGAIGGALGGLTGSLTSGLKGMLGGGALGGAASSALGGLLSGGISNAVSGLLGGDGGSKGGLNIDNSLPSKLDTDISGKSCKQCQYPGENDVAYPEPIPPKAPGGAGGAGGGLLGGLLGSATSGLGGMLGGLTSSISSGLGGMLGGLTSSISSGLGGLTNSISSGLSGALGSVTSSLGGSLGRALSSATSGLMSAVPAGLDIGSLASKATEMCSEGNFLSDTFSSESATLTQQVSETTVTYTASEETTVEDVPETKEGELSAPPSEPTPPPETPTPSICDNISDSDLEYKYSMYASLFNRAAITKAKEDEESAIKTVTSALSYYMGWKESVYDKIIKKFDDERKQYQSKGTPRNEYMAILEEKYKITELESTKDMKNANLDNLTKERDKAIAQRQFEESTRSPGRFRDAEGKELVRAWLKEKCIKNQAGKAAG